MSSERDALMRQRFNDGVPRALVREELGLSNNSMSSLSNKLGLKWNERPNIQASTKKSMTDSTQQALRSGKIVSKTRVPSMPEQPTVSAPMSDDDEVEMLCQLMLGTWQPRGDERPFVHLLPRKRHAIRQTVQEYWPV